MVGKPERVNICVKMKLVKLFRETIACAFSGVLRDISRFNESRSNAAYSLTNSKDKSQDNLIAFACDTINEYRRLTRYVLMIFQRFSHIYIPLTNIEYSAQRLQSQFVYNSLAAYNRGYL